MENESEVIANLNEETKKIYEKHYNSANYDLLLNSEDMILAKKTNTDVNKEKEEILINVLQSMLRKYKGQGVIYINLTKVFNSILEKINDIPNVRGSNNAITWPLRQAITKAIVEKRNKNNIT